MTTDPLMGMRYATARWRGLSIVTNAIENLATAHRTDNVGRLGRTLEAQRRSSVWGGTVVVVGAGPSLDKNIAQLRAVQHRVMVVAVNSAAPALQANGIAADLVVAMENLDVSDQVSASHRSVMCALSSHPRVFARANVWALEPAPAFIRLGQLLGCRPVHSGPSALTMALTTVIELGARKVILVGADLSYPDEGPVYAKGTPWASVTAETDGDGFMLSGQEERQQFHWDHNQPAPANERGEVYRLPSWDGEGTVRAPSELFSQWRWVARRVAAVQGRPLIINATEGGAEIPGAPSLQFERAIEGVGQPMYGPRDRPMIPLPMRPQHRCTAAQVSDAFSDLCEQGEQGIDFSHAMMAGAIHPAPMQPVAPMVEALSTPDLIGFGQDFPDADELAAYRATYEIWGAAAQRLVDLVDRYGP